MGTAYLLLGDRFEADAHLWAAAAYDPEDTYCLTTLAGLAYADGRLEDAVALFAKADAIEPFDAQIQHGWGLALLKTERWADAAVQFRRALAIDPRHAGASDGLSAALCRQGEAAEAVLHARRAVRWTHGQNANMLLTLAAAYAAANRPADAPDT